MTPSDHGVVKPTATFEEPRENRIQPDTGDNRHHHRVQWCHASTCAAVVEYLTVTVHG